MIKVYFDTCIVIYLIEEAVGFVEPISAAIAKTPQMQVCISPLVQMECMVGVWKRQDSTLQKSYEQFFAHCQMLNIEQTTYEQAGKLRVKYGLKTPDALHLATALENGCNQFWTNDNRLDKASNEILSIVF
ncbi:MAG: type II toxin-antitoxin system VapC family toxin [Thiofilum sp.]|uniref:type II toxin-antitoxin system VapC family toxin n=1 Tax=Thiofilum sp. TaxID=2212733 RepID=UPI0025DA7C55|nr:type II toxin-antitoxin system VapC family toxin [Thiofilum sp.]MBK8453989.1 type II toxin-antitoxin system VapC family toxin [Thiofilum sp.]